MKKRKSNDSSSIPVSSSNSPSESTNSAASLSQNSSIDHAEDGHINQDGEEMDVMGTPIALAPATSIPLTFTPSTPDASSSNAEDSTFRRLNFNMKECATPGRYDARHKLGQPLAVYCRVKPILSGELDESVEKVMQMDSETGITCTAPKESSAFRHGETQSKFTFTRVFPPEATQEEVYLHTTQPLVESFYKGQNGLIFAYGITASGKTFTMQGTKEAPGLIPRIVAQLFNMVMSNTPTGDESVDSRSASGPRFTVKASYLEIHKEVINDLLVEPRSKMSATSSKSSSSAAAKNQVCKLQSSKTDEVSVVNLKEVDIKTHREAFALLQQGQANRTIHETTLNSDSSRSHSVFTLKLIGQNGAVWSRLSVVDLAGSERTNRVTHVGNESRMRETVNINQSLLVLGRCLEALRWNQANPKKQKVVPFRDAQITRLFKDSLTGWGRTVMITNASQNPLDYDETIHALKYAAVAKEIRVVPKVDSIRPRTAGAPNSALKRQPSQPLLELDELEHLPQSNAASSWDQDDSNPAYDTLLDDCFRLKQTVVELELKASAAEMSVREELTSQHEEALAEMEENFMERLDKEHKKSEEKYKKLFQLWQAEQLQLQQESKMTAAGGDNSALISELTLVKRELLQARSQINDLQSSSGSSEVLLESTKEMLKDSTNTIAQMNKKVKNLEKEVAEKKQEVERMELRLEEESSLSKEREKQLEKEMADTIENFNQKIYENEQKAQENVENAQKEYATLEKELAQAKEETASVQASLDQSHADLKHSQKELKEFKKEKEAEVKELKKAHENEWKNFKKSMKEEGKSKDAHSQQLLDAFEKKQEDLTTQLENLQIEKTKIQSEKESIEKTVADITVAYEKSQKVFSETQEKFTELKQEKETLSKEKAKLEKELKELTKASATQEKKDKDKAEKEKERVEKEKEKSEKALEKLRKEFESQLASSQEKSTGLQQELQQSQLALQSLQTQFNILQQSSNANVTATSSLQAALDSLNAAHSVALSNKETELKEFKKEKEAEFKELKKQRDAELKEIKKQHKDELKSSTDEHKKSLEDVKKQIHQSTVEEMQIEIQSIQKDLATAQEKHQQALEAAQAQIQSQKDHIVALEVQINSLEQQLSTAQANFAAASAVALPTMAPTPASDPLSDTWGQLLSPIKPAPIVATTTTGAVAKVAKKATAATTKTTKITAAVPTASTAAKDNKRPLASGARTSALMQESETLDPFAFDLSMVMNGPMVDEGIDAEDASEIMLWKNKLDDPLADEKEEQPVKKRKTAATATATGKAGIVGKKASSITVADKENAASVANKPVRAKRK